MKTSHCLCSLIMVLAAGQAAAATYIVDPNPARPAHYRSLGEALAAAEVVAGDVLYLAPSGTSHGNVNITKSVAIIGPGYLLNHNHSFSGAAPAAVIGSISLSAGADGSLLSGLEIRGDVGLNGAHNITIKRNLIHGTLACSTWVACHNAQILQNHILGHVSLSQGATDSAINIRGNYVGGKLLAQDADDSVNVQYNTVGNDFIIGADSYAANNLIQYDLYLYGKALGEHNWRRGLAAGSELSGSAWGGDPGTTFADQFLNTGTLDARWQLKPDAQVRGTGKDGTDPGSFGGPDPYILSGLPALPVITGIEAPSSASAASGLPVNVTVEVNP